MAEPKFQGYTGKNNSLLKSLSSSSKSYAAYKEKEDEEKQKQQIIDAQKQVSKEDTADARPWYEKAGEWTGQAANNVGNFVKDAAVDVYKTGENAVKGIGDVVEGQVAVNEEGERAKQLDVITSGTAKALQDRLGTAYDDPTSPLWDSPEIKAIVNDGNNRVKQFTEANKDKSTGAKQQMQESQNVDATKVAADTAETFLNVATLGVGGAGKQVAKQGIKVGIKELEKQGAKQIAKGAVKAGAEGATFNAAAGLTDSVSNGDTPDKAVENIAKSAAFGFLLGGALGGTGSAIRVAKNNKVAGALDNANAANEADINSIGNGVDEVAADMQGLKDNPLRDASDEDLQKGINDFQSGVRSDDVQADYSAYQTVKDELSRRERTAYLEKGGMSKADAETALKNFDDGVDLPESVYRDGAPIENAAEVLLNDKAPAPMVEVAKGITGTRKSIEDQMSNLMTPAKKEIEVQRLDSQYQSDLDALTRKYSSPEANPERLVEGKPGQVPNGSRQTGGEYTKDVRYITAKEKLDQSYKDSIAENDMLEAQDAQEVAGFQEKLDDLKVHEGQFLNDVNAWREQDPTSFREIDPAERDAQRGILQKQFDEANRFDTPENVVTEVATAPDPVKSFNNNEAAPESYRATVSDEIGKIETAEPTVVEKNFKHIEGVQLSALRIMSPSQVMEKMGLRGDDLDLHSDIIRAESGLNLANKADAETLSIIKKNLSNNKEAQAQMIDYIEGKRQTLSAITDVKAANDIKAFLDAKKQGLEKLGLGTLDDYFPHIFDKKNPEVQRLFKGKATGEISFGNLKERLTDSEDYSRDVMDVLTQYAAGYNRKAILEPALKPLGDLKTQVRLQDAEERWVDGYINQLMGFDQSATGKGYNQFFDTVFDKAGLTNLVGKNHYSTTLGTQRMVSAAATMGLNPGTAVRNMTQMVNTVADIGPRYSTMGAIDGTRMLLSKEGRAELQRVGIMDGGVSQNYFDALTQTGVQGRISKGRDTAVKGLMGMIRATDVSLRAQAYAGAKALARSKGLAGKEAEDFAVRKVVDTQFITSRVDMPLAFNGQGVRSLTQLATFSAKQAGFLSRMGVKMVKGDDGKGFKMKDAGAVLAGVVTAMTATEMLKPVIGMKESEWIPFYDQVAPFFGAEGDSLYRSPLVSLLAGNGKGRTGLIEALQGLDTNGDGKESFGEGVEKFMQDNWSQIVPAGTQIKKTTEGIETTSSGVSKNSQGNIRYQQNQDSESRTKAAIFGQYATENGQQWIKDGFPTLSEKQTTEAKLHPQEKAQYIDYYQTLKKAGGRQKAYDSVKAELLKGNITGAQREATAYNDSLTDAMKGYWSKHDNMPQDLQDDILSKYIDVQKAAKSQDINIDEEE